MSLIRSLIIISSRGEKFFSNTSIREKPIQRVIVATTGEELQSCILFIGEFLEGLLGNGVLTGSGIFFNRPFMKTPTC